MTTTVASGNAARRSCWKHEYASFGCATIRLSPTRQTHAGNTWWPPPLRLRDDLELAEEPLGERAVVGRRELRLELLDRRHRLQRQRHVDEAAIEERRDGSNGAGSQTASGAPESTLPS